MEADYVGTDGTSSTVNGSNSSIENSHTPPVNTINVTTNGSQENDVPAASHNGTVEINGHAATDASAGGDRVLIVGAGPVGLLLALRLGQAGINATVIEKEASTSDLPRACGYAAVVQFALDEAGVYEKMKQIGGFITAGPCWRKGPIENKAGGKDLGPIFAAFKRYRDDDPSWPPGSGTLNLPQAELSRLLYREAVATGRVTVRFNAELDSIKDDGQSVTIGVKDTVSRDIFHLTGTYLVGADGGRSKTRALLGIAFAGHTWPGKLLATDVWVRNSEEGLHPTSYLLDPVHFCVITPLTEPKLGETTLWRYAIGLPPNDPRPDEEVLKTEHIASLYEKVMAGPRPLKYRITNRTVYHIHQRLAATLRRGRCVLAGDAAHVNNVRLPLPPLFSFQVD